MSSQQHARSAVLDAPEHEQQREQEQQDFGSNEEQQAQMGGGGAPQVATTGTLEELCDTMVSLFTDNASDLEWMANDRASQVEAMVPTRYNADQRLGGELCAASYTELAESSDKLAEGTVAWGMVTQHAESVWEDMAAQLFASGRMDASGAVDGEALGRDGADLRAELGDVGGRSRRRDPNDEVHAALATLNSAQASMRSETLELRKAALDARAAAASEQVAEIDQLIATCDALDGLVGKGVSGDYGGLFEDVGQALVDEGLDGAGIRSRTTLGAIAQVLHEEERNRLVARIDRLLKESRTLDGLIGAADLEAAREGLVGASRALAEALRSYDSDAGDARRPVFTVLDITQGGDRARRYEGLDAAYLASRSAELVMQVLHEEKRGLVSKIDLMQSEWEAFIGGSARAWAPMASSGLVEREQVVPVRLDAARGVFEGVADVMAQRVDELSPGVDALLSLHEHEVNAAPAAKGRAVTVVGNEGTPGGER